MQLISHKITRSQGKTRIEFAIEFEDAICPGDSGPRERELQREMNKAATICMGEFYTRFDTQGEPLHLGGKVHTSKGLFSATYQCYGGAFVVNRHLYQTSEGGPTYCPLEDRGRILHDATPHFASILSSKYSAQSGRAASDDLRRNMQRDVSVDYIQQVSEEVGRSVQAKERYSAYKIETPAKDVHIVVVLGDSTCTAIVGEDYKHSAVGCFCLLDENGNCLEKYYVVNAPEDKKVSFWQKMDAEAAQLKAHLGNEDIPWFGLCDGAEDIQTHLEKYCTVVLLDFYHVSTYVAEAKGAMKATKEQQDKWVAQILHALKHDEGAAAALLAELKKKLKKAGDGTTAAVVLAKAVGYIERNLERMSYAQARAEKVPIGSGAIEAACKYIVKQRAGISGARWKRKGLQTVLSLRCLHESSNRWDQFWELCARFGY